MANPVVPNLDGSNPGPAGVLTVNTQSPYSTFQFVQAIAVTITPAAVPATTAPVQSYGLNGATFVTATTGIKSGDVILQVDYPTTGATAGVGMMGFYVDPATTDKFYIQWANVTAGSLTPPSGTYTVVVGRPSLTNSSSGSGLPPALLS